MSDTPTCAPEGKRCGACKSTDTVCIFDEAGGCNIGWTMEHEVQCRDGKFTAYITDYES